ncbi:MULTISPECIES: carbohydrate ABC transporter permease [Streptomyces]|uniref:Transport system permease n=3 Tax=Streptomyces griseoaurantiacus TaxID=68213 RepID=F3NGQ2_9ACTN|nr:MULTISPECIES: carbohydrate ABC transporter permease [Streptomyces]EGG47392.1 transport system permease [Streptomyces griseoaurantiacus M045]MBA5223825.1 carbohydrate ABC transporter permease [Streptomyces griseoaurantiacus]MCF0090154.1 Lactose transport system permease protein LacG [Streptomyces sp. MH192]MCF0103065.1 Lactose transport system permease protein LacG [Streptomyces sp. MH191]MDX3092856.1 carbohydrate ABC transporter permease [Streptomyces sp. ME12-02E]
MSTAEKTPAPARAGVRERRRITDEHGRRVRGWELVLRYVLLLAVLALTVGPFLWQLSTSLKGPTEDIFTSPPRFLPSRPTLHNYERVSETIPVWDYVLNSLKVALANVVTNCVGAALAGYALARLRYRGRRAATLVFILAMLVPAEGIIIAQFTTMRELGLNNTLLAVVLPGSVGALNVLLMRNAFLNVPYEIEEAAYVDGANVWQRFWRVALPSVRGTLAVVAIFAFMFSWDDFLWPLIVLSDPSKYTLTIGLNYLHGTFANDERLVAAGTIIAVAPLIILFACLQRYFFRGVGEGAVKG